MRSVAKNTSLKKAGFKLTSTAFQPEEIFGIGVADVGNYLSDHFEIVRDFAIFDVASEDVAQNPSKIFVAGK